MTYEADPRSRSRCSPRTRSRCSRTSAVRGPAVTFTTAPTAAAPAQRDGPFVADQGYQHRRGLHDADQRPGRWVRGLDEPSVAPLLVALGETLDSFVEIGLGYLSLDRPSGTLSGGEAQRTKMIRHLGSSLTDVTYVFDEPTVGLHPHDIQRMNDLLLRLRDKGNTVLVVEHKPETIAIADHVVDLGPGAGTAGGTVCFEGTVEGLRTSGTITGRHLDDRAALKDKVRTLIRHAGDPRRDDAQPARRRRRHPARSACRRHRRRRLRQELADPRLGVRAGTGSCRSTRPRSGLAAEQPGDVHRTARPDPQRRSPRPTA